MSLSEPRTRHLLLLLEEVVVSSRSEELILAKSVKNFEECLKFSKFLEDKCNGWYRWEMEMEKVIIKSRCSERRARGKRYTQETWSCSLTATCIQPTLQPTAKKRHLAPMCTAETTWCKRQKFERPPLPASNLPGGTLHLQLHPASPMSRVPTVGWIQFCFDSNFIDSLGPYCPIVPVVSWTLSFPCFRRRGSCII